MNKKTNLSILIVGIIVLVLLGGGLHKTASPGYGATRSFDKSEVLIGGTLISTYAPNNSSLNIDGVIESPPAGWASNKALSPDGKIRIFANSPSVQITWTAPNTPGNYTFTGAQYFINPDSNWTDFQAYTVSVVSGSCTINSSCSNMSTDCKVGVCSNNQCILQNKADATTCSIGVCLAGVCQAPACVPKNCSQQSLVCGNATDTCGVSISCGTCASGLTCSAGLCVSSSSSSSSSGSGSTTTTTTTTNTTVTTSGTVACQFYQTRNNNVCEYNWPIIIMGAIILLFGINYYMNYSKKKRGK